MFFKMRGQLIQMLIYLVLLSHFNIATAKESKVELLELTPNKCVALRKGRECFASINILWKAESVADYCLRRITDNKLIRCWNNQNKGTLRYTFRSSQKEDLGLYLKDTNTMLAEASIKVVWVYKTRSRKKRWKIF